MTTFLDTLPAVNVDWANAPAGARWWSVSRDGRACWHIMAVCGEALEFINAEMWPAPLFGFEGDWRESLVERPAAELASSRYCLLRSEQQSRYC